MFAAAAGLGLGGFDRLGTLAAAMLSFAAQIAYEGVRAGRKLHLTGMTDDRRRARYTAISNTLIGLALLAGGLLGAAGNLFGAAWVLVAFAFLALAGAAVAWRLDKVQEAWAGRRPAPPLPRPAQNGVDRPFQVPQAAATARLTGG